MSSSAGSPPRPFFYGGQAVVEGVMMRGPQQYAVAVRLPKGGIRVERGELRGHLYTHPVWRLPFLRGLAVLGEQLHLGMRCLVWSAAVNAGEQDIQIGKREVVISLTVGILFSVLLFIGLPLLGAGVAVQRSSSFWFVVVEGVIRIVLVLGYLSLIGMVRDVRRVFQYHGAEHKTINALEQGWELEPASVRRASTLHPRCGTGFLLVVLVVSVLVFSLVAIAHPNWVGLIGSRIVGVPVIAAVSYEWIRFLAGRARTRVGGALLVPVLLTQRFTTREPDDSMLEVAIAALKGAMRPQVAEEGPAGEVPPTEPTGTEAWP